MPKRIFRILGGARFKRRRIFAWLLFFSMFSLLLYFEQNFLSKTMTKRQTENDVNDKLSLGAVKEMGGVGGANNRFAGIKLMNAGADRPNNDNKTDKLNPVGDPVEDDETRSDLIPDLAPSTVHFVWCGRKFFEFRHYLSVKRAESLIKPDKIMFHYKDLPTEDKEHYYTWFNQTLSEIAHVVLRPLNSSLCPTDGAGYYMLVLRLLESFGGIFIPVDTVLVDFPVHLRAAQFLSGVVARSMSEYLDGVIVAKKNGFISPSSQNGLNIVLASGKSSLHGDVKPCGTIRHFNTEEDGDCLCVKVHTELYPSDVWSGLSHFDTLSLLAAYGVMEVHPKFNFRSVIPRIGHYICWDCELKFDTYISVLSSLHVAGLSKV